MNNMIVEKFWKWGRDTFRLFIDMEKAFDCFLSKPLNKFMLELPYFGLKKLVRVIKIIYRISWSNVRKGRVESDWFNIKAGVR